MPRVGFEPTISAGERPKTYALDRAATGTGNARYNYQILTTTEFSRQIFGKSTNIKFLQNSASGRRGVL